MNSALTLRRNLGPEWGGQFLLWAGRCWPRALFRGGLMAGTWVALACLPGQRAHSRAYLALALGRPPRPVEVWRHFFAFMECLVLQLRVGAGAPIRCRLDPEHQAAFEELVQSDQPALFGSFHFGRSDLLGYLLGERGRRVSILRLQVGNSTDTRLLGRRFARQVRFLWINDAASLPFQVKAALEAGDSLALTCDRREFSAKQAPFRFLGAARLFPFTIYHLAVLFDRPVVFCTAVPGGSDRELRVFASAIFRPDPAAGRTANLQAAHRHFQAVLTRLEELIRAYPFLWFNFLPLNAEVPAAAAAGPAAVAGGRREPVARPPAAQPAT